MTKTNLEVLWISGSLLALEVKRLNYTSRLLESSKGELKTPQYPQLNSRGRVPTLTDGDVVVREALAIMAYLDRKYPDASLFGADERQAAWIWQLISEYFFILHGPAIRVIEPLYFGKVPEKRDDILAAVPEVHVELKWFEGDLERSPWFGGEVICAADIVIYPFMKSLLRAAAKDQTASLDLGLLPLEARYPRLSQWMQRLEKIPGYENTYPQHWRP